MAAISSADDAVMDLDTAPLSSTTEEASMQTEEIPVDEATKGAEIDESTSNTATNKSTAASGTGGHKSTETQSKQETIPAQSGPLVDLLGPQLLSLEIVDDTHAQLLPHLTNEVLKGKEVIGVYFSADWCGPCRKFTPELMSFYQKMNARKGKQDQFQIVWVSRCRDMNSFGQYFAQMNGWLALPPQEAMGQRGEQLSKKYNVKGIPSLVLLDDLGHVITTDARNKIPADKAGVGFPWRNPIANIYLMLVPRPVRFMIKSQISGMRDKIVGKVKGLIHAKSMVKAS
jgi:thiol-disulfide isomerase/thioredoxin